MIAHLPRTGADWVLVAAVFGTILAVIVAVCICDLRDDGYPWRGIVWRALWMLVRPIPGGCVRGLSFFLPPSRRPGPSKVELQERIEELEREVGIRA